MAEYKIHIWVDGCVALNMNISAGSVHKYQHILRVLIPRLRDDNATRTITGEIIRWDTVPVGDEVEWDSEVIFSI